MPPSVLGKFWGWGPCCRRPAPGTDFDGDPEEAVMSFAGTGRGAYTKSTSYKYVGEGAGEFEMVASTAEAKSAASATKGHFALCCGAGLGALAALALIFGLWPSGGESGPLAELAGQAGLLSTPAALRTKSRAYDPYDCEDGFTNFPNLWPADKMKWCCSTPGRPCPKTGGRVWEAQNGTQSPLAAPAPAPALGDPAPSLVVAAPAPAPTPGGAEPAAEAPARNGSQPSGSSAAAVAGKPAETAKPPYACDLKSASAWSQVVKDWCCTHEGRGCPNATSPDRQFDCKAGYGSWASTWSKEKKAWCCRHKGRACYDCDKDVARWSADWSVAKKQWCCKHAGRACQPAPPSFVPATA